jgi:hypothetical protein
LRGENFFGAHAFEPVIACVEFADMFQTQPTPFARSIEAVPASARRTVFARLATPRVGAFSPGVFVSSVKLCLAHSF